MKQSKSYGQFCPVARASEIVATRWTPVVLRELLAGSTKFNDLRQGLPLMSPSLLSKRLGELENVGIITKRKAKKGRGWEYRLTDAGRELAPIVETLGIWGQRFVLSEFEKHELDPTLLMWDIHRRVDRRYFPEHGQFTADFTLRDAPPARRHWWLVIKDRQVDLCIQDPGYEIDLYVDAGLKALTDVWMGRRSLADTRRDRDIVLDGQSTYLKSFPKWFLLSPFAPYAKS
ncbi:MAG TPA: helix-turn-helix domain-containing protein [Candidatus Manganitrophaceae bacterium]|nr:helix-turn-helix domain-containing protein [Candidatus Manganitrophaceae bacterium]